MAKRSLFLILGGVAAMLAACAPEVVPTSGHLAATKPEQVKIYQKEPAKYEKLGIVSLAVTGTTRWQESADATPAFENLRAQAAALGANGLLLIDDTNKSSMQVGARFQNNYYLVPLRRDPDTAAAQAIFVIKE